MASHKQYDGKTDVLIDTHGGPPGRRKRLKILYIANFLADEKKTVTGIDGDIFTFSPPLEHNHIAGCEITFAALTATPSTASSTATSSSAHPSTPTHPSTTTSTSKLSRGENTITLCKTSGINVSGINVGTQFTIGGEASQLYTDLKKEYSVGDPGPRGGIGSKTLGSSDYLKSSGAWSSSLSWDGPKSSKLAKQVQNLGCRIAEYLKEESYVGSLVDYHYAYMRGYRTDAKDFAEKNKIDVESKRWKRKAWKHNYMPKHCDQEADPAVPIAGISLGDGEASARDLKLECGRDSHTITLQPCSLYVMLPPTNTPCKCTTEKCMECSWLHSIPESPGATQRLSITFRCANLAGSGGGGGSGGGDGGGGGGGGVGSGSAPAEARGGLSGSFSGDATESGAKRRKSSPAKEKGKGPQQRMMEAYFVFPAKKTAPALAPAHGDDEDAKGAWKCTACTFLNANPTGLACSVCGTKRYTHP